jgi:hypothetical protein
MVLGSTIFNPLFRTIAVGFDVGDENVGDEVDGVDVGDEVVGGTLTKIEGLLVGALGEIVGKMVGKLVIGP